MRHGETAAVLPQQLSALQGPWWRGTRRHQMCSYVHFWQWWGALIGSLLFSASHLNRNLRNHAFIPNLVLYTVDSLPLIQTCLLQCRLCSPHTMTLPLQGHNHVYVARIPGHPPSTQCLDSARQQSDRQLSYSVQPYFYWSWTHPQPTILDLCRPHMATYREHQGPVSCCRHHLPQLTLAGGAVSRNFMYP